MYSHHSLALDSAQTKAYNKLVDIYNFCCDDQYDHVVARNEFLAWLKKDAHNIQDTFLLDNANRLCDELSNAFEGQYE